MEKGVARGAGRKRGREMDEVIQRFNEQGVRYLLIGGQALRLAGMPRFSMDWDFFIPPRDEENIVKINKVLGEAIDIPVVPLGEQGESFVQTYQTQWGVLQFHLGVPGLADFDEAEKRSVTRETEAGVPVMCAREEDLLASKTAAGRAEDQADIEFLQRKETLRNRDLPDK